MQEEKSASSAKKVFLVANISEIIQNNMPVKYRPWLFDYFLHNRNHFYWQNTVGLKGECKFTSLLGLQAARCEWVEAHKDHSPTGWHVSKIQIGDIAYVLIKIGEFIFPIDFVVLETASVANPRGQIPAVLDRSFLATSNALINCRSGLMKLTFENLTANMHIFNLKGLQSDPSNQSFKVNMIQDFSSE